MLCENTPIIITLDLKNEIEYLINHGPNLVNIFEKSEYINTIKLASLISSQRKLFNKF